MRVTSDLWVAALLRRVFSSGGFGAVLRRGGESAGAVFIVTRSRQGEVALFAPAPQTDYEEGKPLERRFTRLSGIADDDAVRARMEKELRFDPDVWFVEIELSAGPSEELFAVTTP